MRRFLFAMVLIAAVFVGVFRQRLFLLDPLGKVERNGAAEAGAKVYINYSNDVLLEDPETHGFVLVQGCSRVAGVPKHLGCFTGMACWTDADQATVFPLDGVGRGAPAVMNSKEVTFVDSSGVKVRVELR